MKYFIIPNFKRNIKMLKYKKFIKLNMQLGATMWWMLMIRRKTS